MLQEGKVWVNVFHQQRQQLYGLVSRICELDWRMYLTTMHEHSVSQVKSKIKQICIKRLTATTDLLNACKTRVNGGWPGKAITETPIVHATG